MTRVAIQMHRGAWLVLEGLYLESGEGRPAPNKSCGSWRNAMQETGDGSCCFLHSKEQPQNANHARDAGKQLEKQEADFVASTLAVVNGLQLFLLCALNTPKGLQRVEQADPCHNGFPSNSLDMERKKGGIWGVSLGVIFSVIQTTKAFTCPGNFTLHLDGLIES